MADMDRLRKIIEQEEASRQKIIDEENKKLKEKALEDAKKFAEENDVDEKEDSEKNKKEEVKKSKKEESKNKKIVKKSGKLSIKVRNYLMVGMLVILLALFFIVLFSFSDSETHEKLLTCGDGSFNGTCSIVKPYFCDDGYLVESAKLCGCPEGLSKDENSCINKDYYNGSGEVMLEYVLDGEIEYIPFVIYQGVLNYLDTLPKHLSYSLDEMPRRDDFKFMKINDPVQREALMPLVVAIQNLAPNSKDDQARIAISLVQRIDYGEPEFQSVLNGKYKIRYSNYPYKTVSSYTGSCEGKSELLLFLLRELGFGTTLFYFKEENHEAVGVKCPVEYSYYDSGYCFVETTVPSPISFSEGVYLGVVGGRIVSEPKIIFMSKGFSLSDDLEEYSDSDYLDSVLNSDGFSMEKATSTKSYPKVVKKYGLEY